MAGHEARDGSVALTIRGVVAEIGLSRSTIYGLIREGQLPTVKIGCRRLVLRRDLDAMLEAGRIVVGQAAE